jgi:hypothetical protein
MPSGAIPPGACPELRRRGQDDIGEAAMRGGVKRRCVPTMNIPETPCHREGSERSHRLRCTTPWSIAATRRVMERDAMP